MRFAKTAQKAQKFGHKQVISGKKYKIIYFRQIIVFFLGHICFTQKQSVSLDTKMFFTEHTSLMQIKYRLIYMLLFSFNNIICSYG